MFADLKVSTRLAVAFGTIVVLLVIVITLGVSRMTVLNDHLHSITDENDPEASLANELQNVASPPPDVATPMATAAPATATAPSTAHNTQPPLDSSGDRSNAAFASWLRNT